jgi:hypothetical protein
MSKYLIHSAEVQKHKNSSKNSKNKQEFIPVLHSQEDVIDHGK